MYGIERRYLDRFEVPGAEVVYRFAGGTESRGSLADITKISVRFETDHQFNAGDHIELEIFIPERNSISVRGNVVRIVNASSQAPVSVAVQFLPFGSDERYNTMESYSQLNNLTEEYMQKVA
jgi:hypothetical protein